MDDELEVEVQDLAIDEIRELLQEAGTELSHEQAEQLSLLVVQSGGVDEALAALVQLAAQREAA
jgi:hypothetical protein